MALQRLSHSGAVPATGLSASITSAQLTFGILSATGYPSGSNGPFTLCLDPGGPTEEHVFCLSISGTTVTVASGGRGFDNTTAQAHNAGTTNVEFIFTAAEADDNNAHVYTTTRNDHTQYPLTTSLPTTVVTQLAVGTGLSLTGGDGSGHGSITLAGSPRVCRIVMNATQSITGGAGETLVQFNQSTFDTLTGFNDTTHTLTCPLTGYYRVYASLGIPSSTGTTTLAIVHNGSVVTYGTGQTVSVQTGDVLTMVSDVISCAANDTLAIDAQATNNNTLGDNSGETFVIFELLT